MPITIAVSRGLPVSAARAFTVLATPEMSEKRIAREQAMHARLEHFDGGPETLSLQVVGQLPPSWVPPGVSSNAVIHRVERWQPNGHGFLGSVVLSTDGLPVRTEGVWELRAESETTSRLGIEAQVGVAMPVVGPMVERLVAERIEKEFASELDLMLDLIVETLR